MATKTVRAPMPRSRRAKQFMPFDALRGLKEAIAAKERVIEPRRYLSEDAIAEINDSLLGLHKGQIITIVYYGDREQSYLQIGNITIEFPEITQLLTDTQPSFSKS